MPRRLAKPDPIADAKKRAEKDVLIDLLQRAAIRAESIPTLPRIGPPPDLDAVLRGFARPGNKGQFAAAVVPILQPDQETGNTP